MYTVEVSGDNIAVNFRSLVDVDAARDSKSDLLTYVEIEEKRHCFLLDFLDASGLTDEAKNELVALARRIKDANKKMAVVCGSNLRMALIQMFEGQSGLLSVRIFSSRDEASQWLNEES